MIKQEKIQQAISSVENIPAHIKIIDPLTLSITTADLLSETPVTHEIDIFDVIRYFRTELLNFGANGSIGTIYGNHNSVIVLAHGLLKIFKNILRKFTREEAEELIRERARELGFNDLTKEEIMLFLGDGIYALLD